MKNIWVIGNGFDLYHGLKTGYRDFVRRVEDAFGKARDQRSETDVRFTELCNINGFFRHFHFIERDDGSWAFFEDEMRAVSEALSRFEDVVLMAQRDPEYDLTAYQIISGLFTYRELKVFRDFSRIFEQIFDDPSGGMFKLRQTFITPDKTLDVRAMVNEVRRELDDFSRALDLYLTSCVMEKDCGIRLPEFEKYAPDYVISFNFTDTPKLYGVVDEHIFHVDGRAGSQPVNLVLGDPDGTEDNPDWISLKKYFRRLTRFAAIPDMEHIRPTDGRGEPDSVTVRYFGYSFPQWDEEFIREIGDVAEKTVVYYKNGDDYAAIVLSLIRIFGKDKVTGYIYGDRLFFENV